MLLLVILTFAGLRSVAGNYSFLVSQTRSGNMAYISEFRLPPINTSRRVFLRGLASAGIVIPFLSELSPPNQTHAAAIVNAFKVTNPSFSRNERDRRWAEIRRIMAKAQWNFDAILAPANGDTA